MALTKHEEIELKAMKQKAARLYQTALTFGGKVDARHEFHRVWKRVKELDPTAPDDPFNG